MSYLSKNIKIMKHTIILCFTYVFVIYFTFSTRQINFLFYFFIRLVFYPSFFIFIIIHIIPQTLYTIVYTIFHTNNIFYISLFFVSDYKKSNLYRYMDFLPTM
ncbi:hypothetical protein BMW23_0006 [Bodo saltans virus]|uniref:Transmembrane protein n=1 Tax=Bodo saltans virus TaxID=2024608 RepID=A0A2H4UT81_9VIRU|nr:hypothetical protein QJ851_gp0006 [Bodo saltans virus]ATZ80069.1 hypothetical protein BMW23_0006 [Bodo saltans virus]